MATDAELDAALNADELVVWRGFLRWSEGVTSSVKRILSEEAGVSHPDYVILVRLAEGGGAVPRQHLEQALAWSASRLSHQLRRMESRDLVRRADAGHGRHVDVEITENGRRLLAAADAVHGTAVRSALLGRLPTEVAEFLRREGDPTGGQRRESQ